MIYENKYGSAVGSTELLNVGDIIEFYHFGRTLRGAITQVAKYGYWISDNVATCGAGWARCPFGKEKLIKTFNDQAQLRTK